MKASEAPGIKRFRADFDALTARHGRGEAWRDWINLCALSISASTPCRQAGARRERYQSIISKYDARDRARLAGLFGQLIDMLEAGVQSGAFGDVLGDLFMRLELSSAMNGQFFTPFHLCRLLARLTAEGIAEEVKAHGRASVNEPACGAGATLIAAAEALRARGIDYQDTVLFVAQDLDPVCAMMCYTQLSLLGCAGWVRIGNTLGDPPRARGLWAPEDADTWITPAYYAPIWELKRKGEMLWTSARGSSRTRSTRSGWIPARPLRNSAWISRCC